MFGVDAPHGADGPPLLPEESWQRLDPATQALIVALTGYGQPSDRQRSADAGFDQHLVKPVDPDALRALLAGLKSAPA